MIIQEQGEHLVLIRQTDHAVLAGHFARELGSDEFAVPLCRVHHRELHCRSDEPTWWQQLNIDPMLTASALWAQTRPALTNPEVSSHGKAALQENRPVPPSAITGALGARFDETKPILGADTP